MLRRDEHFATTIAESVPLPSDFLQRLAQRDRDIAGLFQTAHLSRSETFLLDHVPIAGRVVQGKMRRENRPAYPPRATREALANAIPEKPQSRLQRDLLTDKGRAWLT